MVGFNRVRIHVRNIHKAVLFLGLTMASQLSGCATTSADVRALRMYQHQEPTPQLLDAHLGQMQESLSLIQTLLHDTPYQPDAAWVSELALDDAKADRARELVRDPACRASFVCIYNTHVRSVVEKARVSTGSAAEAKPRYRSICAALAAVDPSLVESQ
jgi:hypothetical protein